MSAATGDARNDTVAEVRAVVDEMRAEMADWDPANPQTRVLAGFIRLLELAVHDAAGVEAQNERTRRRAEVVGGDGHTWVMHHQEWSVAIGIADAWRDGHQ
ncbi:hypothetical protein [Blastococcus sp. TF02A-26]|uniref:hypothetical protein n=1 Tax=Blastococcus sp. TF02A-26 TaxID=2250577 RepID=UPI000DE8E34A|nr:hypothetical protein [Blastococcus sp. TF02A-26]RBY82665.1 hypothetical protein DQ240_18380 [Blastococcus sp. TF02A-26]